MNKILSALGLSATATEDEAVSTIELLKTDAGKAEKIELARITDLVDTAISDKRITAEKRDHFITLGKSAGFESLQVTIGMLTPARKPTDIIGSSAPGTAKTVNLKYSDLSADELKELRENNRPEYIKLYKAEFGFTPELD